MHWTIRVPVQRVEDSQRQVQEIRGGHRIDEADTGSERPGRVREIRKETSECEVECTDSDRVYHGISILSTGIGCACNHAIQVAHLWRQTDVSFPTQSGSFNLLLNGRFRFTSDGECGATRYRRFGCR